jgi:sensor histidine kinase YesM
MSKLEYLEGDLRLHTYFIPDIIYTYVVSYYLVNRYLMKEQVRRFVIVLVMFTLLTYVSFLLLRIWDYNLLKASGKAKGQLLWTYTMKFATLGPPVICAMFLSLKFLKQYHRKTEENKLLISENTKSQLGQLKAQIHPHFLFNTLSNIHSFAISAPLVAGELVSKLSDTMKYMIYECEAVHVDVQKELKMIKDYMALQSVRYGNALKMNVHIKGDPHHKKVTPLFLIPLIENAFKHGTSQVLNDPWINVDIEIKQSSLVMHLTNSTPVLQVSPRFKSGIGLNNVRKRLELIHPLDHTFKVYSTDQMFSVEIEIPLYPNTEEIRVMSKSSYSITKTAI